MEHWRGIEDEPLPKLFDAYYSQANWHLKTHTANAINAAPPRIAPVRDRDVSDGRQTDKNAMPRPVLHVYAFLNIGGVHGSGCQAPGGDSRVVA
jgi:hypothetical protein